MSPKELKEQKDTKEKIIEVAARLFARHGFTGTSVREIAKQADVNLSAINYHFDNKDNLYLQVFVHNYQWLASNIEKLGEQEELSLEDLSSNVFQFFINNGPAMMNTFKIFLSDEVTIPPGMMGENNEEMGPPGHIAFLNKINQVVDEDVTTEAKNWAVKMIFSNIVHLGLCTCTSTMKEKSKSHSNLSPEKIEKSIVLHTKAIISYIQSNKTDLL